METEKMTEQEFDEQLKNIEDNYQKEKYSLHLKYGLSHSLFKKGDIIRDERWAILIDKITVSKFGKLPEPVYLGFELKKDLTPRKDGKRVSIHGNYNVQLIKKATE